MDIIKILNSTILELNEVIAYLVKSIPAPYANTSVFFPVPNCRDITELTPCFYQEMPINGDNPILLLDNIKVSNLVLLFRLLLFEQKILLVSDDYDYVYKELDSDKTGDGDWRGFEVSSYTMNKSVKVENDEMATIPN